MRLKNLDTFQKKNAGKQLSSYLYLSKTSVNEYVLPEINGLNADITESSINATLRRWGYPVRPVKDK